MINRDLEKQVHALKRQLESETLLRVDLENKNKTLREELQFNQQLFQTVRFISTREKKNRSFPRRNSNNSKNNNVWK